MASVLTTSSLTERALAPCKDQSISLLILPFSPCQSFIHPGCDSFKMQTRLLHFPASGSQSPFELSNVTCKLLYDVTPLLHHGCNLSLLSSIPNQNPSILGMWISANTWFKFIFLMYLNISNNCERTTYNTLCLNARRIIHALIWAIM